MSRKAVEVQRRTGLEASCLDSRVRGQVAKNLWQRPWPLLAHKEPLNRDDGLLCRRKTYGPATAPVTPALVERPVYTVPLYSTEGGLL